MFVAFLAHEDITKTSVVFNFSELLLQVITTEIYCFSIGG